jgi:tetratricopeptide (TPR) repeat protein
MLSLHRRAGAALILLLGSLPAAAQGDADFDPLGAALRQSAEALARGQGERALAAAEVAAREAPDDPAVALARAAAANALGRAEQARAWLAPLDPALHTAAVRLEWARALRGCGESQAAEAELVAVLRHYPRSGPARAEWIELLLAAERRGEARDQLALLRAQAPQMPWALAAEARLRAAEGELEPALAELEAALPRDDERHSVRAALVELELSRGGAARAASWAAPWFEQAPDPALWVLGGRAAAAAGDGLGALELALRALRAPHTAPAATELCLELLGAADELSGELLRARLQGRPADAALRGLLVRAALDRGDFALALDQLAAAPAETTELNCLRVEALRRSGRAAAAEEALAALLVVDATSGVESGPPRAFYERGLLRFEQSAAELAAADFERAAADPALAPLARFNQGVVLERAGRAGPAAQAYERAVAADPTLVQAWLQLGQLYHLRLGERDRAADAYRRVLELAGEDAQVRAWLAEVER